MSFIVFDIYGSLIIDACKKVNVWKSSFSISSFHILHAMEDFDVLEPFLSKEDSLYGSK